MVGRAVIEADRRLTREPVVQDRVPKPRAPLSDGATREIRGKPSCEPNAPQLIRLVRTPFSVTPTFNTKHPPRDRLSEREARRPYHEQVSEALDRPVRPGLPGIFRELPAAPAPRLWRMERS